MLKMEIEGFDPTEVERVTYHEVAPLVLYHYREMRRLVSERNLVLWDIRLLQKCKTDVSVQCLRDLTSRYEELVSLIGARKQLLSASAQCVLKWTSTGFISMDPWEPCTTAAYRHERYKELRKAKFMTIREELEYQLLRLVEEDGL